MLRYLRRVDDLTTGKLRWGILTNGARWRLYYQGARSVSEQFFELDLARVLGIAGHDGGLFALTAEQSQHWLKVFLLIFGRDAFLPSPSDTRTFHQRALEEGHFYEERVAKNLSSLVFGHVFPELAYAIAAAAPTAPLPEVRDAAFILLYRLLFVLLCRRSGSATGSRLSGMTSMDCVSAFGAMSAHVKIVTTRFQTPPRDTGRYLKTSVARLMGGTGRLDCRRTMAAYLMPSELHF